MSDANVNQLWARVLVEELVRGGVRHAVVCPGSRSTPLALACQQTEGLKTWSVIDERSAGFFALGIGKRSRTPAVVIATSGTAGAHFYPAVIEASLSNVPMLVLTADRPPELHGWGAPQTVPQARLFGEFARFFADTAVPEANEAVLAHLRATAARAVSMARRAPRGAVHLNVPFREPLAPTPEPFGEERLSALVRQGRPGVPMTHIHPPSRSPDLQALERVRQGIAATERGLIVCGPRDEEDGFAQAIAALSQATGYPILAEAASQARYGGGAATISLYDVLLRHAPFAQSHRPELVLRFGGGLTPKRPQQWLDSAGARTILFSDEGALFDPSHRAEQVIEGSAVTACEVLAQGLSRGLGAWARGFLHAEQLARNAMEGVFAEQSELSEPRIAHEVVASLPTGANLFVSSSMPIRDVDAFAPARGVTLRTLSSRGANGIDGIISSALGMAVASEGPSVLLSGDLAFLHDVGGLLTAHRHRLSLTVVVVNNDGGGIFSFLPIAHASEHFEALFGTPHGIDLSHAAALYGARFHRPTTPAGLRAALAEGLRGGLHVVEVQTDRTGNVEHHQRLFTRMAAAVGEGPWA
ncbi:2-succinyl-5-enolpyruvyl-6-hydroxy-3-cyclohexene-1-carboxylic-acid synthase [Stigmatella aurantiaca]|uniref:2-succinyl-5-enolpyruvyl-6-hydroxy-3-cyclohexene-1-carboxylate synthase n=1 Tax=Stigmatella aurantiaca (strain DW4/3-1) TaxID=378806 RepID=Q08SJ3_STIAD|nr:2-succinyl-5-enolpyruvyl-6-hydroxy-3-cyclohexene-1-carboxylic-acid synthase [Stigmatella aurantiaca]ADO71831.1 2-succinyl-5-enolpyruvyl-6-hydroxy-3-cyclohexene-1-carboxylate synthase [Stigmatella aurantiaca DW4/3-1]EAU63450.1 2-succinyl-6-hydroxy-2,4-cyclohexadiene-1-carboxylic acid synthase/2-oxoglutarate decarboxylase [Stigmatella aurantiaca DW4/3-1]